MKYILSAVLLLGSPAPSQAQETQVANSAPAGVAEIDPQRLALARIAAAALLPPGSYERLMQATMTTMADTVVDSMFDMRATDVVPEGTEEDAEFRREVGDKTLRELAAESDPHFEERMRITNRVMFEEIIPIVSRLEPEMREGLARAYARKFTVEQLSDMNRFFASPSGRAYAAESLPLWTDPEVMALLGKLAPAMIEEMPAIMEKVAAATAHLPPPPEPKKPGKRR